MPAKASSKTDSDSSMNAESSDFVLKHRVVGAGVILFFGALVLPWLLGAPSEARKNADAQAIPKDQQELEIDQKVREELLASLEAEQELPADQVYVSKITPLSRVDQTTLDNSANQPVVKEETPVKKEPVVSKPVEVKPVEAKPVEKSPVVKSPVVKAPTVKPTETAKPKPAQQKPAEKVATKAPVTVGWVVQVGVFTDKNGVAKVLADLQDKGFSPSTTIVDTNRGKKTGTRIWLGPFAERVQAAQMITRLSEKTGDTGFIRAYP